MKDRTGTQEQTMVVRNKDLKQTSRTRTLRISSIEWQETFDAVLDVVALISADFEILKLNQAAYEMIGKKPEEFLGKKCYEVVHGLSSPIEGCPCQETLKTKQSGNGEIQEHGRCYLATASPIFDHHDELVAFAHTIKDITERKEAEQALKQAYESLEKAVRERTAELERTNIKLVREIEDRKRTERFLQESQDQLQQQGIELAQKNMALREIIAQIEIEKRKINEDIRANVEAVILPILNRMEKENNLTEFVHMLRVHLEEIATPYGKAITDRTFGLTSRELEVCHLVKSGFTNKEISKHLGISSKTVEGHRKKISHKLDITHKGINLSAYLQRL